MPNLVSDGAEFSCNFCTAKLKLTVTNSSSSGDSKKLSNQTNCFLPPPAGGQCTFIPGMPPPPCAGAPPGTAIETGQTTVKIDGQTALGEGCQFMCPLYAQPITLSKPGQEIAKSDEAECTVGAYIAGGCLVIGGVALAIFLLPEEVVAAAGAGAAAGARAAAKVGAKALKQIADKTKKLFKSKPKPPPKSKATNLNPANDNKPHKIPPLSKKTQKEFKSKQKNRTLNKEDYKKLDREKRFTEKRKEGVREFWDQEEKKLINGEKGSRDWTPKQKEDILNGKRPKDAAGKTIEGHHKYSAREYPQHANNPNNIEPLTRAEHQAAHGGNFRNPTHGQSLLQTSWR